MLDDRNTEKSESHEKLNFKTGGSKKERHYSVGDQNLCVFGLKGYWYLVDGVVSTSVQKPLSNIREYEKKGLINVS